MTQPQQIGTAMNAPAHAARLWDTQVTSSFCHENVVGAEVHMATTKVLYPKVYL